jgi:hypothetical protein
MTRLVITQQRSRCNKHSDDVCAERIVAMMCVRSALLPCERACGAHCCHVSVRAERIVAM